MSRKAETSSALPSPWADFLQEVDHLLGGPVELHCLGGFVLAVVYQRPLPTSDIDYIKATPAENRALLDKVAGLGSPLSKKYKLYVQYVGVHDVPRNYEDRLAPIAPSHFRHLRLLGLEAHDLALSKLTRNNAIDREDVRFLAARVPLDPETLRERYERELRPDLSNQDRHDLTLRLWLEDFFAGRG